jgi:two-component system nitrogen regulation response regulator NtrX
MPSVLVVDDEANLRWMVGAVLAQEDYEVHEASDAATGLAKALDVVPDVLLLDLMMPGPRDGLELLEAIRAQLPDLPVVMMSGKAALADAVQATRLGAVNFLEKPLSPEGLVLAVANAMELRQVRHERAVLRADLGLGADLVGDSPAMVTVRETIARVARSDARVLITGESGTGKELAAASILTQSARRERPLIRVPCAAIPAERLAAVLFGQERGAITGDPERRIGHVELAHGGTLVLDEVAALPSDVQRRLRRLLDAREIERLGGTRAIKVEVRVVATTRHDLPRLVREGRFDADLYFGLNVVALPLPPLRERPTDLPALVAHFEAQRRRRGGPAPTRWTDEALNRLARHPWPGNVRELANVLERVALLHEALVVGVAEVDALLPTDGDPPLPDAEQLDTPLADALDAHERLLILRALAAANGVVAEAARRLRTDRPNLYRRMKRLGIGDVG